MRSVISIELLSAAVIAVGIWLLIDRKNSRRGPLFPVAVIAIGVLILGITLYASANGLIPQT